MRLASAGRLYALRVHGRIARRRIRGRVCRQKIPSRLPLRRGGTIAKGYVVVSRQLRNIDRMSLPPALFTKHYSVPDVPRDASLKVRQRKVHATIPAIGGAK